MDAGAPAQAANGLEAGLAAALGPLLGAVEWSSVLQAFELASTLGPEALAPLVDGVSLDEQGRLAWTAQWSRAVPVRGEHREDAALLALSMQPGLPLAEATSLDLCGLESLRRLAPLAQADCLEVLRLDGCKAVQDLSPLAGLHRLRELRVTGCDQLDPLPRFPRESALTVLVLANGRDRDLDALGNLSGLQALVLRGWSELRGLDALTAMQQLERLILKDCPNVSSLAPLQGLRKLKYLSLTGLQSTLNLHALAGLPGLEELDLSGSQARLDLEGLRGAGQLRRLDLSDACGAVGLDALLGLERLEELDLPAVADAYRPLGHSESLDTLLAEMAGGSRSLRMHHEGREAVLKVAAACAVLQTLGDRDRFATWSQAAPVWQKAFQAHPGLARFAVGRMTRRHDGKLWWPASCPLARVCRHLGAPAWLDEALGFCATWLLAPTETPHHERPS